MALARELWGEKWFHSKPEFYSHPPLEPFLGPLAACQGMGTGAVDLLNGWYVVACFTRKETLAAAEITAAGFPCYVPRQVKSVRVNLVMRRRVMRALLPGYVFAQFDVDRGHWGRINRDLIGVIRVLKFGERPWPVPPPIMKRVHEREAALMEDNSGKHPPIPFAVGVTVQAIEHPAFVGFIGKVTELLPEKQRVKVELDLFGRLTPVEMSVNQLRTI